MSETSEQRSRRLAQALRDNLQRRKAQARARDGEEGAGDAVDREAATAPDAAPHRDA